ncbi:MAG: hypothetical protein OXU72_07355, partial [Gammaproteobacteria bacterium]|nr:hypothetical protein [Gammaproteobacteria bacterium]
ARVCEGRGAAMPPPTRPRILKVARTIADLADAGALAPEHVAEAIHLRCLDRLL